jgi:thiamine biosynthesis lipoprotein
LSLEHAQRGLAEVFAAIGEIHRLMSFHEPSSDVTRLNQQAARAPVQVDAHTFRVLSLALELSRASSGLFDITVADKLVAWRRLPRPSAAPEPDPSASWTDIELLDADRVRFHRPLWIDLGGIAKGYAVDCAVERVAGDPDVRWVVNAGGDLRVSGRGSERILLRTDAPGERATPVVDLEDASLASSSGRAEAGGHTAGGPHVDPRRDRPMGTRSFVSVVAQRCAVADALTKVAMASPARAAGVLETYGATAFLNGPDGAWKQIGCIE